MLREIKQHYTDLRHLKIVYISPLKALAAEMTRTFKKHLSCFKMKIEEVTGDTNIPKAQLEATNIIVATPEKYDVLTRKQTADFVQDVQLLIIDEIHLLDEERGAVIETIVARTLRLVESQQRPVEYRILHAPKEAVFHFDMSYRAVPMSTKFITLTEDEGFGNKGKKEKSFTPHANEVAFDETAIVVKKGKQVIIFVHTRRETVLTAKYFVKKIREKGLMDDFFGDKRNDFNSKLKKLQGKELNELLLSGIDAFRSGTLKVLVSTATLAWGVNLPAHTVIIKGTEVFNSDKGKTDKISILDVLQMFGRAGRPQFDTEGAGIIITDKEGYNKYLAVLGKAIGWFQYTYLYVCMKQGSGLSYDEVYSLVKGTLNQLENIEMTYVNNETGTFTPTLLGRIASHYYVTTESMYTFSEKQWRYENATTIKFNLVREEEKHELGVLARSVRLPLANPDDLAYNKANILLQSSLSHVVLENYTLISETLYANQNASRITRALFELACIRSLAGPTLFLLDFAKMIDRQQWGDSHPLSQFSGLPFQVTNKLQQHHLDIETLCEMDKSELVDSPQYATQILAMAHEFPQVVADAAIIPLTSTYLDGKTIGRNRTFWVFVGDANYDQLYYFDSFNLSQKRLDDYNASGEPIEVIATIPVNSGAQYIVDIVSDRYLGSITTIPVDDESFMTKLLRLHPIPTSSLKEFQPFFDFHYFNPPQTQFFHICSHTNENMIVGSPTGSGKTVAAELLIYVAPMKALVKERLSDWKKRLLKLNKKIVELTGDFTPDTKAVQEANVILTTPEKWDGITRLWKKNLMFKKVGLIILDEVHILGEERGPVIEALVTRTKQICSKMNIHIRLIALTTAIANIDDMMAWMNVQSCGVFNFHSSLRPVPLIAHIEGFFLLKVIVPRMATMNKPAYQAIKSHSPTKPVLIFFVSSRRQTRITAQDLMMYSYQ
ncbi:U5 small nuclear ribonucleoprotein 200 kDa helicase [Entamoeba marina]